jgi:hypothetical protein
MPIFNGVYCFRKFVVFATSMILIISLFSLLATLYLGLIVGIGIIGLGLVLLNYIVDQYGDYLLMAPGYYMSQEEMKEFGKKKISNTIKFGKTQ